MSAKIVQLYSWEIYDFPWGSAVKERRTRKWQYIFLKPDGQEINVEHLDVILHENGIEFVACPQGSGGDGPNRKT